MATNLRLTPIAVDALRTESERTGRSQQQILRQAVDEHLGLIPQSRPPALPRWVQPPSEPYRRVRARIAATEGGALSDVVSELREDRL